MRANMRGSIRKVMVTDSENSPFPPATAFSIKRTSGLFSAQKPASAASLSKIGTSSHLAIERIVLVTLLPELQSYIAAYLQHCIYIYLLALIEPGFGPFCAGRRNV